MSIRRRRNKSELISVEESSSHWRCLSGQSHRGYRSKSLCYYWRNNEMNLCCSFEHLVTIWKEEMNQSSEQSEYNSVRCLAHYDKTNEVQSISIDCDQIVVCHQTLVNIWNITNGIFLKTFSWNVHAIAKDPNSHFIALFEKSFRMFIFFCFFSFEDEIQ